MVCVFVVCVLWLCHLDAFVIKYTDPAVATIVNSVATINGCIGVDCLSLIACASIMVPTLPTIPVTSKLYAVTASVGFISTIFYHTSLFVACNIYLCHRLCATIPSMSKQVPLLACDEGG